MYCISKSYNGKNKSKDKIYLLTEVALVGNALAARLT